MNHHSVCVFIILSAFDNGISEAVPQFDVGRSILNFGGSDQQNLYRQGSINEFLALRPSHLNQNDKPCVPQQFYPVRIPHRKINMLRPLYVVNNYEQNINNNVAPVVNHAKPPYNSYGGYFCGNQRPQRPIQQPIYNNNPFWSHFSNIFSGVVGPNTNVVAAALSTPGSGTKPAHEDNDHNNNPNEVRIPKYRIVIDLNQLKIHRLIDGCQVHRSVEYKMLSMIIIKIFLAIDFPDFSKTSQFKNCFRL